MEEIYRLGKHEFATREEWEGAKRDLEKIETIVEHLDIDDPEVAEGIYHYIREGKVEFESKLGTAFFCDISDRVAQNFEYKLEKTKKSERHRLRKEKKEAEEEQKKLKDKERQQSQMFKFLGISCVVLAVLCISFYGFSVYRERRATRKLEEVQQQRNISQALDWYADRIRNGANTGGDNAPETSGNEQKSEPEQETERKLEVLPEYSIIKKQYPDFVGWIYINDTQIDLPVMQTTDNAYYLDKDANGMEDVNGTLFLDCRDDFVKPSTNLIIYGHNMKSGAMFGGLKQYLEESYLSAHDRIEFDTIYEKQTYQIVAVCLSDVGDEGAYRYYNFIEAESDEDFNAFLTNIRSCAVYDRTQDVTKSDKLLTLSTCNNYVEDGRLFVVAKKLQ